MSSTRAPYRSDVQGGSDSFVRLLHAEWTKLRTVRGWVVGLVVAAVVMVLVGLPTAAASRGGSCGGANGDEPACSGPVGPGGEPVTDSFYFVHQPLDTDGSITVRVTSLTGLVPPDEPPPDGPGSAEMQPGLLPWAKAGLIIKESTDQGSAYAAIMVTGDHGVRMQHNFTHDTAGTPAPVSDASPRWLRLTRSGDTITGEESADGTNWTRVGTARLDGLPSTVEAGLFVASPFSTEVDQRLFGLEGSGGPTRATGVFDRLDLQGAPEGAWTGDFVGDDPVTSSLSGFEESGTTLIVTGSGDIAPAVGGQGFGSSRSIEQSLVGTFAGLIAVIVVATMFMTAEYRRDMIHTTLAACPRRGRVLAAKAVVIAAVSFVTGLAAAGVAVSLGGRIARSNGVELNPVGSITEVRVVVGTAALLAVAAILAVAVATLLRRSAGAVTALLATIVLPYILATASVLPEGPSEWLLRLSPAAAFSVQQTLSVYPQVSNLYAPVNGYFPLAPWAGFAVLCGYAMAALALAAVLLHRRDA